MRDIFLKVITGFLMIFLGSCASTGISSEEMNLMGMIYDDFNKPVGGANIDVDGIYSQRSDNAGRFIVPDLKTGYHTITATKSGYETKIIKFELFKTDQALYINLISIQGIKNDIETALSDRKYYEAEKLILRGEAISPEDPVLRFQKVILYSRTKKPEKALEILYALMEDGYKSEEIYLFILDIYNQFPETDKNPEIINEYQKLFQ